MISLSSAFSHGKAFIPFITCGDPDLETTARVIRASADAGASMIELGFPFSDPTAEGPVIMAANARALASGTTSDKIFDMVRELRSDVKIPFACMTYANVVYSYGTDKFLKRASEAEIRGLILPDVPLEERGDFAPACREHGVSLVPLVAPTSEGRISAIAKEADGFIYIVSSLGVTGVRSSITTDIGAIVGVIRGCTDVPCAVGFGISTPEQARRMAGLSDGAIVGSAIMKIIAEHGRESAQHVGAYVRTMADALRS